MSTHQLLFVLACCVAFLSNVDAHKHKRKREASIDDFEDFINKHAKLGKPPSSEQIRRDFKPITQRLARDIRAEIQGAFLSFLFFP